MDVVTGLDSSGESLETFSRDLFNNPKFADLIIVCGGQEFHCHRAILLPRVPYLAENCSPLPWGVPERFYVSEHNSTAIRILLEYVYTWKLPDCSKVLAELHYELSKILEMIVIAQKYGLGKLQYHIESGVLFEVQRELNYRSGVYDAKEEQALTFTGDEIFAFIPVVFDPKHSLENLQRQMISYLTSHSSVLKLPRFQSLISKSLALACALAKGLLEKVEELESQQKIEPWKPTDNGGPVVSTDHQSEANAELTPSKKRKRAPRKTNITEVLKAIEAQDIFQW